MKKFLKVTGVVLLLIVVGLFVLNYSMNEDMPTGKSGAEADAMALEMMSACNADAWAQTRYVKWTFVGKNTYLWDRTRSRVKLENDAGIIILDSRNGSLISLDLVDGKRNSSDEAEDAWANFCNDSFWLIAPLKVMDPGTRRELVETEEGNALLVHFESGGVTPGDSYLWHLSEDGLPYSMQMWTQSPPLNGIRASWTDWQQLHTGVMIATTHMIGKANVAITDLSSGSDLVELGIDIDPFNG